MEPQPRPALDRRASVLVRWAVLVAVLEAFFVGILTSRELYSDAFYNLVAGREIVRHGLSATDPWTFLGAGRRWVDQQWLAHVLYYSAELAGGMRAVSILSALLVGASVGVLAACLAARRTSTAWIVTCSVVVGYVAEVNALVRAQSFAYVAFAVSLLLLLDDWKSPAWRRRAGLVVTVLVWANVHGSVVAFVPIVVLAWGVRAARDWHRGDRRGAAGGLVWSGAICAAAVTTPYGLGIVGYYRSELTNTTLQQHISEWQAASYRDPAETLFFVALLAVLVAGVYALRARMAPSLPVLAGALWFGYSGLVARRSEVWFTFFAALLVCEIVTRREERALHARRPSRLPQLGRGPVALGASIVLVTMVAIMGAGPALAYHLVPLRAVAVAAQAGGPRARICADNDAATPLEWLYPATRGRVAFDARFELYSQPQLRQIFSLIGGPGQRLPPLFDRCDVLLVDLKGTGHPGLERTVRALRGFRVTYDVAGAGMVAVRRPAAG